MQFSAHHYYRIVIFVVYIFFGTQFCLQTCFRNIWKTISLCYSKRHHSANSKKEPRLYGAANKIDKWQLSYIKKRTWESYCTIVGNKAGNDNYVATLQKLSAFSRRADELSLYHVWAWDLFYIPLSHVAVKGWLYIASRIYIIHVPQPPPPSSGASFSPH